MNIYESLLAKAINGGGTPTVPHIYKFSGTIAQPFSADVPLDTVMNNVRYYNLKTDIEFDASALGYTQITQPLQVRSSELFTNGCDSTGTANDILWGYEDRVELVHAYVFAGGSLTDVTEYASLVLSEIYVYSTFPISGLEDYEL